MNNKEGAMAITGLSPCVVVRDAQVTTQFYHKHFGARITFDCGWYVNLAFECGATMQLMQPQSPEQKEFSGGLTLNLALGSLAEVDAAHERLSSAGLTMVMPLEDHPWGDRGFAALDPNGVVLYLYHETAPAEEFRKFYT